MSTNSVGRLGTFICLLSFLFSCDDSNEVGLGLSPPGDVNSVFVDTFSVEAATVLADELPTENNFSMMAGRYVDPDFGSIESRAYYQLITGSGLTPLDSNFIMDSLVFNFFPNYEYGLNDINQTFRIHQTTEVLADSIDYTNQSAVPFLADPILEFSMKADSVIDEGFISITLPIESSNHPFVDDLIDLVRIADINENFIQRLKGLVLIPEATDDAKVIGFTVNSNPTLQLFYHDINDPDVVLNVNLANFRLSTTDPEVTRFNQYISDRGGSPFLSQLSNQNPSISSEQTNNIAFIQGGSGVRARLNFPTVKNLANQPGIVSILEATLIIRPVFASNQTLPEPSQLVLYRTDANDQNQIATRIVEDDTVNVFLINDRTGGPALISYLTRFESYEADITTFLIDLINGTEESDALILGVNPFLQAGVINMDESTSVNRFLINAAPNNEFSVELQVFYNVFN